MALISTNYFRSENVKVFPCSFRGQNGTNIYDPEARLQTEYNLTRNKSGIKDSYVISFENIEQDISKPAMYKLCCVIGGYYFEISDIEENDLAIKTNNNITDTKTLFITTRKVKILNDTETDVLNNWDGNIDGVLDKDGAFLGIFVDSDTAQTGYYAKLKPCTVVDGKLALDQSKLLPEIEHGAGINTVVQKAIIEGDPATANEATQWWAAAFGQSNKSLNYSSFTAGTRNTNNGDSAFIAGADNEVKETGLFSIVGGDNNVNEGRSSLVVGEKNTITSGGRDSIVCGGNNEVDAASSVVGGRDNVAYTNYSLVVGEHLVTNWKNKHVLGVYNDNTETDDVKLFSVGNGGDNKQIVQTYDVVPNSGNQHTFNSEIDLSDQTITISIKISDGNCRFRLFNNAGTYTSYFTILPEGKLRDQISGVSYETLSDKTCVLSITSLNIQTIKGIKFDTGYSPATGTLIIQYLGLVRSNAIEVYDNGNVNVANELTVNTIQSNAIQVNNTIMADAITVNTVNANDSLTAPEAELTTLNTTTANVDQLNVNDTLAVDKIISRSNITVAISSFVTVPALTATGSMQTPAISTNKISTIGKDPLSIPETNAQALTVENKLTAPLLDTTNLHIAGKNYIFEEHGRGFIDVEPAATSTVSHMGTGYIQFSIVPATESTKNQPTIILNRLMIRDRLIGDNQGTNDKLIVKFWFNPDKLAPLLKAFGYDDTVCGTSEALYEWWGLHIIPAPVSYHCPTIKYGSLNVLSLNFKDYRAGSSVVDAWNGFAHITETMYAYTAGEAGYSKNDVKVYNDMEDYYGTMVQPYGIIETLQSGEDTSSKNSWVGLQWTFDMDNVRKIFSSKNFHIDLNTHDMLEFELF